MTDYEKLLIVLGGADEAAVIEWWNALPAKKLSAAADNIQTLRELKFVEYTAGLRYQTLLRCRVLPLGKARIQDLRAAEEQDRDKSARSLRRDVVLVLLGAVLGVIGALVLSWLT